MEVESYLRKEMFRVRNTEQKNKPLGKMGKGKETLKLYNIYKKCEKNQQWIADLNIKANTIKTRKKTCGKSLRHWIWQ